MKSALADKEAIREIEKKRNKQYTEDDYKQLESMMYDNYSVQLIAAQVRCLVMIFAILYFSGLVIVCHRREPRGLSTCVAV